MSLDVTQSELALALLEYGRRDLIVITTSLTTLLHFLRKGAPVEYPFGPPVRQDYPLDLSILLSGGKETNQDSLSNGE